MPAPAASPAADPFTTVVTDLVRVVEPLDAETAIGALAVVTVLATRRTNISLETLIATIGAAWGAEDAKARAQGGK